MAEEFTMPKLGLTMTDGTIREWLVEDGAFVQAGEPLLVIETDKVETEVEARSDGVFRLTGVVGSTYECGAVIGYLLDAAAVGDIPDSIEVAAPTTPGLMAIPDVDDSDSAPFEDPAFEEPTLDLFGDEAVPVERDVTSRLDAAIAAADGLPVQEPVDVDDDVHLSDEAIAAELDHAIGEVVDDPEDEVLLDEPLTVEPPAAEAVSAEAVEEETAVEESSVEAQRPVPEASLVSVVTAEPAAPADIAARGAGGRILASPRARATAHDAELSLASISGTGPGGRIVHDDVVAGIAARAEAERAEADRRHAERLEAARQAEAERVEAERVEAERLEAERVEAERVEAERIEAERLEAARLEAERLEAERLEAERLEAERVAAERLEAERLEAERLEEERRVAAAAEADRLAALPPPPTEPVESVEVAPQAEPARERPLTRAATQAQATLPPLDPTPLSQPVAATGGARLLADFLGIDLADVEPSAGGRVTREDVGAWVRSRLAGAPPQSSAASVAAAEPGVPASTVSDTADFAPLLQEPADVIPFKGMRGLIAQRMRSSLSDMAQLTLSVDVDMAGVNAERERRRSQGQQVPGYTAWVVSAAAQAIEEHGYINSQITSEGIAVLPDVHVGVAVALDEGLIVPVIEHANLRTVEETHAVVADLAGRARVGKLQFEELEGATFSVTALGMYGVDMFTPVINPPNTAILGVGRLRSETGWVEGRPVEKTVMTLSLTWDHRAFDGAPAAEFAQTIVRLLQQPTELV